LLGIPAYDLSCTPDDYVDVIDQGSILWNLHFGRKFFGQILNLKFSILIQYQQLNVYPIILD
jgi:hypothetical protein